MQAAYSGGMLVGSLVFGATSDMFGRRFCIYVCAVLLVSVVTTSSININKLYCLKMQIGPFLLLYSRDYKFKHHFLSFF